MSVDDPPEPAQKPPLSLVSTPPTVAEHDRPDAEPSAAFTFWHYYLAAVMQNRLQSPAIEVKSFVKLGSLPLEADIIILRRRANVDLEGLAPDFDFLLKRLPQYLVCEYKSPDDRLTLADLDTVRAYAMLCKRKFGIDRDEAVAVVMLYSRVETGFFAGCARNGHPFVETEPGIWACTSAAVKYYAVDLVAYGSRRPGDPILLFSSQYRQYQPTDEGVGAFRSIYEEVFYKEAKRMAQTQAKHPLPGMNELAEWMQLWAKRVLPHLPANQRLEGLSPEERLRGLQAKELLQGLSPEQRAQLKALLEPETSH